MANVVCDPNSGFAFPVCAIGYLHRTGVADGLLVEMCGKKSSEVGSFYSQLKALIGDRESADMVSLSPCHEAGAIKVTHL